MATEVKDKREAILKAALRLFTERGFDDTPTSLISKEAGVATGTLFRYFATKEELINAAYAASKGHMAESLRAGLEKERSVKGKARRIWGNTIRWGLQNPEEFHFIGQFASSPYITKITEKAAMDNFGFLGDIFEEGMQKGIIKDSHGMLLAEMVFNANRAVIEKIVRDGLEDDMEDLIDASFSLIWRGIGKN